MNGCKFCPAYEKCSVTYRGSSCAAIRYYYGLENDPEIVTNGDKIRAMSDEELATFLAKHGVSGSNLRLNDLGYTPTATELAVLAEHLYVIWMRWLVSPAEEMK